jgi:hypothetical protein
MASISSRCTNSAHKSDNASETSFSFTTLPSRSKISMLKMLLRTVDLKELRNTQDFLNKRTTNNQAAHGLLAFPLGSSHRFFNTPEKTKETLKPRSTSHLTQNTCDHSKKVKPKTTMRPTRTTRHKFQHTRLDTLDEPNRGRTIHTNRQPEIASKTQRQETEKPT